MTVEELKLQTKGLSLKACVITGWQLPDSIEYVTILDDQIRKFLVDEYQDINVHEFEYAMRKIGTETKDWGKSINLALIREALDGYKVYRSELSKLEEQKSTQNEPDPPMGDTDWSDTWERLKSGEYQGLFVDLVPYGSIYDWLVKTAQLAPNNANKWRWLRMACTKEIGRISLKREAFQATPDDRIIFEQLQGIVWVEGKFPEQGAALNHLIAPSKTIAVKELLKTSNT